MQTWNIPDRKGLMTGRKLSNQCNHMISRRASSVATTQQALHGDTSFHGYNTKLVLALNILWYKFQLLEVIFYCCFQLPRMAVSVEYIKSVYACNNHAKAIHHWLLYPAQQKLFNCISRKKSANWIQYPVLFSPVKRKKELHHSQFLYCFLQKKEKQMHQFCLFFFLFFYLFFFEKTVKRNMHLSKGS